MGVGRILGSNPCYIGGVGGGAGLRILLLTPSLNAKNRETRDSGAVWSNLHRFYQDGTVNTIWLPLAELVQERNHRQQSSTCPNTEHENIKSSAPEVLILVKYLSWFPP